MLLCNGDRKPLGYILTPESALNDYESQLNYGAKELRYYLDRITSASFEWRADDGALPGIVLSLRNDLGEDGFELRTKGDRLYISGGVRGVLYGIYEMLERIGCRFFTHNAELIPTKTVLELPVFDEIQKPMVEYREHNYTDVRKNTRFAVKCRFNGSFHPISARMGGYKPYAMFVHTFEYLVPPSVYGKEHPEYYAEIDGKRCPFGNGSQLCLTNPDVLPVVINSAREWLLKKPESKIISISQNDGGWGCTCAACRAMDAEEGSAAGTLLRFVNKVAEALEPEFPDVVFDTLAYTYTRCVPKITRNRHNVCVRLCSIESCFAHSFETCDDTSRWVTRPDGTRSSFINDLREWGRVCDRMYIWDYTTCFAHYPSPHPNWRALQPNVQAMVKNNVKGIFEQGNGASHGGVDFNELRLYLISKLLWNPYCDLKKHREEFMDFFYGAAAKPLSDYLDDLCDTAEKENLHVGFNDNLYSPLFREEKLDEYDAFFEKALQAVADDPLRLYRVEKARLSVRWVRLKKQSMMDEIYDAEAINRFFADWRAFDLSRIDEWCNFETTHRALLDGKWRGIEYWDHWTKEEPEVF